MNTDFSDGHTLRPKSKMNLSNSEDIRREMGRVYREARSGRLYLGDATKFIFMLSQIIRISELPKN